MSKHLPYVLLFLTILSLISFNVANAQELDQANRLDCTAITQIPQIECEALVAIHTSNPGNAYTYSWFRTSNPCYWDGLSCDNSNSTIYGLSFYGDGVADANKLTNLPPELGNLVNLGYINLSFNKITELPPEIGNLDNVYEFYMMSNLLKTLPPEIGDMVKLEHLHVGSNELEHIPPEIGNIDQMVTLSLSFNNLTDLPSEIVQLPEMFIFSTYGNPLCITDPEVAHWLDSYNQSYDDSCLDPPTAVELQGTSTTTTLPTTLLLIAASSGLLLAITIRKSRRQIT